MTKFQILKENIRQFLIATDQLLNPTFGIIHSILDICHLTKTPSEVYFADESLSAHSERDYRNSKRSWPKNIIDTLFFFDPNHCYESYQSEVERRQLPPEYRV